MRSLRAFTLAALLVGAAAPVWGQTPKPGGVLQLRLREDLPQGFAMHETVTISTMWPAMPCFSNLVMFDPLKPTHSAETVIGELAERWSWQDSYRNLVVFLRKGVTWHDGKLFSAADVKFTFDMLREAPDAGAKLRINPRREWYANVESVDAIDPTTVVFRLKRPQPALLLMLASGYTPIYAAHLSPASYRTGCIGTGPFKLKEWRKGEFVEYVRNPQYFLKGHPHLDGLRYVIIAERAMATGALELGRVDAAFPGETTKPTADRLRQTVPKLVVTEVNSSVFDSLIVNTRKAPFQHAGIREALSRAIDRRALINAVYQGGAALGATMGPRAAGAWGLGESELRALPGYGRPADEKAKARALLSAAGFGPGKPLRVELLTRALPAFADVAAFVVNEFRSVGVEVSMRQVDTAQWYPLLTRGDFELGIDRTGIADDPDANFYENFTCGSPRNYSGYCDDKIAALIDQQSEQLDPARRIALVHTIQKKLEETAARPVLCWRLDYFAAWPYVKNLIPHQSIYSWGRMQDVWLDK